MPLKNSELITSIDVYNGIGQLIYSQEINENQWSLDLSKYSNGLYFVAVNSVNGLRMVKVVKK